MVVVYFAALAFVSALAIFALALVIDAKPKPFVRNTLITLLVLEVVLTALQVVSWQPHTAPFLRWFFNMNVEWSLGTVFSSAQLLLVSLVALVNAARPARWWERVYWLLFSFAFGFMALDEFYIIREYLLGHTKSDFWLIPYGILGLTLGLYSLFMFWHVYRAHFWRFVVLAIGMGLLVGGAIVLEALANRAYGQGSLIAARLATFEEDFEMIGCTLCLAAMLLFAQANLSLSRWRVLRGVVVAGGVGWTIWLLMAMYVVPTWEATTVSAADVDYDDGIMSLLGYDIPDASYTPGAEIPLTLYWRANEPLPENFSMSVHLLTNPDSRSVSQTDELDAGPYSSSMWLPGAVMKRSLWLPIPADVPTPASYSIMVRVWSGNWPQDGNWEATQGLVISQSDHAALADDALILADVSVLSPDDTPQPAPQSADYRFASGFTLYGYSLPESVEAGGSLPVGFWWRTQRNVDANLIQYVHLLDENGTMVAGEGSDQQPFGGRFPTADWPANLSMSDAWQVPLPADIPAGNYRVYMGLYDPSTVVRD
ncbi:MAG: hypothetical protein H7175_11195, partial [Burkholderiales bacterium]|nr:hypothetical protein [Anaerolineae bacterium]